MKTTRAFNTLAAALLCVAPLVAGPARAADDVMRCGSKLVNTGMVASQVLALCGEPKSKNKEEVPQQARRENGTTYVIGTVIVEHWYYDRGPGKFPAYLKFEESRLVSLEFVR